jgi:ABC-type uncharacterized transport system substrate-binding protein
VFHRLVSTIFFVAVLLVMPGRDGNTHPHVWIDSYVSIQTQDDKIQALHINWQFDRLFSHVIVADFDLDGDLKLSQYEVGKLIERTSKSMSDFNFFTHVWLDSKKYPVKSVKNFSVIFEKGRIVYSFIVPFEKPIDPKKTNFAVGLYDDSYYVDIVMDKNDPVRFDGNQPQNCQYQIKEDKKNSIYSGLVNPLTIFLNCGTKKNI